MPSARNLTEDSADLVCVGAIFGVAGVKGAVRIRVFAEDIRSIAKSGPLIIFGDLFPTGKKVSVDILHNVKNGVAAKLRDVNDRNLAEQLKGAQIYVERNVLPEIEAEDQFYFEDLVGLVAKDKNGDRFGIVDGVFNFGAGDIVEIKFDTEKTRRMYPFSDEIVPTVDLETGYIVVDRDAYGDEIDEETK